MNEYIPLAYQRNPVFGRGPFWRANSSVCEHFLVKALVDEQIDTGAFKSDHAAIQSTGPTRKLPLAKDRKGSTPAVAYYNFLTQLVCKPKFDQ
jgi:hypothetical protein